jgi:DNA repair exonuclease SbcCD ATPase subunit
VKFVEMVKLKEEKEKYLQRAWKKLTKAEKERYATVQTSIGLLESRKKKKDASEIEELTGEFDALSRKKLTVKEKDRIAEIDEEIIPLKEFLDDAAAHRQQIKLEIGMCSVLVCF